MYPPDEQMDSRYSFSPEARPFSVEADDDDRPYDTEDYCPYCNCEDGEHKRDCPTYIHGAGF